MTQAESLKRWDWAQGSQALLRYAALPALFALLNLLPLAACSYEGISRKYVANLDFAPVLMLAATGVAIPLVRLARDAAIFLGLVTVSLLDLFISLSDPFNHGVFGGSEYAAGVLHWPWSLFLPWIALVFAASILIVVLLRRAQERIYASGLVLVVVAMFAADLFAGNTHFLWRPGTLLPNLVSSSSLRFAKGEQLTNGLKAVTPLSEPTMATRMEGLPDPPANILSVSVESLGLPRAGGAQSIAFVRQLTAGLGGRYAVAYAGAHRFDGKTLQGELRELCGVRVEGMPKTEAEFGRLGACLPQALRQRGYTTAAYHGNSGDFYHRASVYPSIGITDSHFRDDLVRSGRVCDRYMFKGVCDRDVFQSAMTAFKGPGRHFVHVMTLDTHFPQAGDPAAGCGQARREARELCLYDWYFGRAGADLAAAIEAAPTKPDLIVLYGDHAPPFADRNRDVFSSDSVPYYELRRIP
ncbi:MAG: mdoB [Caulobacteraceae bacterium]|nr:mdoB [Caulobacteraceae bacterium]